MIIQVTRKTSRWVLLIVVLAAAGLLYSFWSAGEGPRKQMPEDEMISQESTAVTEEEQEEMDPVKESEQESPENRPEIAVHVSGAVADPDKVYHLPEGARVEDAVLAAGGALPESDLSLLNLAGILHDGQKLYVPYAGEEEKMQHLNEDAAFSDEPVSQSSSGLTNINFATTIELEALPGIGEVYALRIIQYREENGPFQSIEEIQNVKGIGASTFEKIRDRITI